MQIRGTTLLMILVKDTPNESSLKHITVSTDVSTPSTGSPTYTQKWSAMHSPMRLSPSLTRSELPCMTVFINVLTYIVVKYRYNYILSAE